MNIPKTKRCPNNLETDQLPIFEVMTGLPRPYHNNSNMETSRILFFIRVGTRNYIIRIAAVSQEGVAVRKHAKYGPKITFFLGWHRN